MRSAGEGRFSLENDELNKFNLYGKELYRLMLENNSLLISAKDCLRKDAKRLHAILYTILTDYNQIARSRGALTTGKEDKIYSDISEKLRGLEKKDLNENLKLLNLIYSNLKKIIIKIEYLENIISSGNLTIFFKSCWKIREDPATHEQDLKSAYNEYKKFVKGGIKVGSLIDTFIGLFSEIFSYLVEILRETKELNKVIRDEIKVEEEIEIVLKHADRRINIFYDKEKGREKRTTKKEIGEYDTFIKILKKEYNK